MALIISVYTYTHGKSVLTHANHFSIRIDSFTQQAITVESNDNGEFMIENGYHLDAYGNSSCMDDDCINHNLTCVGEELYCNYTYTEYVEMLYDYIYPSVSMKINDWAIEIHYFNFISRQWNGF